MRLDPLGTTNYWMITAMAAMTISSTGCGQTPSQPAPATQQASVVNDKAKGTSTTNRIMARLDGLSGDKDPRLLALSQRLTGLGMTVLSMGVTQAQATTQTLATHSAFIVVSFDPSKNNVSTALASMRTLETFAYVEADQLLQKR